MELKTFLYQYAGQLQRNAAKSKGSEIGKPRTDIDDAHFFNGKRKMMILGKESSSSPMRACVTIRPLRQQESVRFNVVIENIPLTPDEFLSQHNPRTFSSLLSHISGAASPAQSRKGNGFSVLIGEANKRSPSFSSLGSSPASSPPTTAYSSDTPDLPM